MSEEATIPVIIVSPLFEAILAMCLLRGAQATVTIWSSKGTRLEFLKRGECL
jgi:hypothetical protein